MEYQWFVVELGQLGKKVIDKETETECKIWISSYAVFLCPYLCSTCMSAL